MVFPMSHHTISYYQHQHIRGETENRIQIQISFIEVQGDFGIDMQLSIIIIAIYSTFSTISPWIDIGGIGVEISEQKLRRHNYIHITD